MKINSDSKMALSTSVEKKRFLLRHFFTTSSKPGCKKGKQAMSDEVLIKDKVS